MLLLLVGAYISASIWLIHQGVIYTGLLYILVYVGAIVVLIMFVVQLTNTSLNVDTDTKSNGLIIIQNIFLIVSLILLILLAAGSQLSLVSELLLTLSHFNLTETNSISNTLLSSIISVLDPITNRNNLSLLAFTIFNEYGYILVLSVHAIILAIIGPIKLAISDLLD